jgi:Flp pilus assembly protein TadB
VDALASAVARIPELLGAQDRLIDEADRKLRNIEAQPDNPGERPRRLSFGVMLVLFGLVVTASGAGVAANAVIVTPREAVSIGVMRIPGNNIKEDLQLPAVKNLMLQSQSARAGLWIVAAGTFFQILGTIALALGG